MKKKRWLVRALLLLLACLIAAGLYNALLVRHYAVDAEALTQRVRIAVVADLHSCSYGENAHVLVDALDAQAPDLVVLVGDFFDDKLPDDHAEEFLAAIAGRYPCYYVTGNHEFRSGNSAFAKKMAILERYGVKRLAAEAELLTVNGQTLNICGVDDPDVYRLTAEQGTFSRSFAEQLDDVRALTENGNYTVLLSHRPESLSLYAQYGFDLVLCGHAHGGQWRIPGLMNGVLAPNQGFFPKYAGGLYQEGDTLMLVSRGLARESTRIPRFYNRPELVIVDLS